jgi:hypothetical protein
MDGGVRHRQSQSSWSRFEKPEKEYLVPFGKVTEILKENGFELVGSSSFQR